jgi:3-hydroxyisobutyrate dehydrogenase-like beta-hydroxyacid dehydrogenase
MPSTEMGMQGRKLVGFVGVGVMGRPMSQRLIEAGYDVLVHDRDAAAMSVPGSPTARAPWRTRR